MERLILIRHGSYDKQTGSLDPSGHTAASKIGNRLKTLSPIETEIIFSPVLRTKQTAQEIQRILQGPTMREEYAIASDASMSPDIPKATTLIEVEAFAFKNIIVISHADVLSKLADFAYKTFLNTTPQQEIHLSKGTFLFFDIPSKTAHQL